MKGNNNKNNDDDDNDKISSSSSIYNYIPITALDNYGRSKQLHHAMQSTKRYGMPIVACICCSSSSTKDKEEEEDSRAGPVEDVIVVCSLQRLHATRTGVIASTTAAAATTTTTTTTTTTNIIPSPSSVSIHGMVRILATKDDDDGEYHDEYNNNNDDEKNHIDNENSSFQPPPQHTTTLQSAIVITGVGSDATYLTDKLRYHINKYWFRYDTTSIGSSSSSSSSTNTAVITKMIRDILLDCMGYNRNDETLSGSVSGGIGSAAGGGGNDDDEDGGDEQQQRAGRPLGICTFLLSLGSRSHNCSSHITVIEANGVSEEYVAHAMGMGSEIANNELAKKWRRHMGQNEAIDMIKGILQGVALERGWLEDSTSTTRIEEEEVNEEDDEVEEKNKEDDDERETDLMVVCEIVSSRGINIQYMKL
jgi:20S proteasome alpha/beta subunit